MFQGQFETNTMVLDPFTSARIVALAEDGRSQRYIARMLRIPKTTVQRAIQRYQETGQYTRRPGSGRPRATRPVDDRFIVMQTLRNRFQTASETATRLRTARNVTVSVDTVRRRLAEANLHSSVPARGPLLTSEHRRARLRFAHTHQDWTDGEWSNVLFTDESRFSLFGPDGRGRVWRRRGERYAHCNMSGTVQFGGGSIMVWGGICLGARTELHVFGRAALNAHIYLSDILQDHVVPFGPFIGDEFVLMHDNARPHRANIVNLYLNEVGIRTLEWPARSPDLNPIEHLWDQLGVAIRRRLRAPASLQELRAALLEEWERIPQDRIDDLIRSMPRRLQAVIQGRGGNTRY